MAFVPSYDEYMGQYNQIKNLYDKKVEHGDMAQHSLDRLKSDYQTAWDKAQKYKQPEHMLQGRTVGRPYDWSYR